MVDLTSLEREQIAFVLKLGSEELAQSRTWEQLGYVLLPGLLTILGVIATKRIRAAGLSAGWLYVSVGAVFVLVSGIAVAAVRYTLLSMLYFHTGVARYNIVQAFLSGKESKVMDGAFGSFETAASINMDPKTFHLAHLFATFIPPRFPIGVAVLAAAVIGIGQFVSAEPKP